MKFFYFLRVKKKKAQRGPLMTHSYALPGSAVGTQAPSIQHNCTHKHLLIIKLCLYVIFHGVATLTHMESQEEKPIIYTMENKPIVTCECF